MMLFDMHTHLYSCTLKADAQNIEAYTEADLERAAQKEVFFRKEQGIASCINCGTPEEWRWMQAFQAEALLSFGIHPWYSDQYEPETYMEAFRACSAVGEIGMDSVWCNIPLNRQEEVFRKQLTIAADLHKPVVLHTKGQEHRIAQLIRDFPEKICVHWYSGSIQELQPYLEKDCYFTIGSDFSTKEELHRYMMQKIPADRLFLESDGIASIIWAAQEADDKATKWDVKMQADAGMLALLPKALNNALKAAASEKKLSEDVLSQVMWANRSEFFCDSQNK